MKTVLTASSCSPHMPHKPQPVCQTDPFIQLCFTCQGPSGDILNCCSLHPIQYTPSVLPYSWYWILHWQAIHLTASVYGVYHLLPHPYVSIWCTPLIPGSGAPTSFPGCRAPHQLRQQIWSHLPLACIHIFSPTTRHQQTYLPGRFSMLDQQEAIAETKIWKWFKKKKKKSKETWSLQTL